MKQTYKPGEVVQLICGGPFMVIRARLPVEGEKNEFGYVCNWISETGEPKEFSYLEEQIQYASHDGEI